MYKYYDENGREIPASEVEAQGYDVVDAPESSASWFDALASGASNIIPTLGQAAVGGLGLLGKAGDDLAATLEGMQASGVSVPYGGIARETGAAAADTFDKQFVDANTAALEGMKAVNRDYYGTEGLSGWKRTASDLVEGGAPLLLAAPFTGPLGVASLAGGIGAGQKYGANIAEGYAEDPAAVNAALSGLVSGAGTAIGFKGLSNPSAASTAGRRLLSNVLGNTANVELGNLASTFGQVWTDKGTLGKEFSPEQIRDIYGESFKQGLLMGPALGAMSSALGRPAGRAMDVPQVDAQPPADMTDLFTSLSNASKEIETRRQLPIEELPTAEGTLGYPKMEAPAPAEVVLPKDLTPELLQLSTAEGSFPVQDAQPLPIARPAPEPIPAPLVDTPIAPKEAVPAPLVETPPRPPDGASAPLVDTTQTTPHAFEVAKGRIIPFEDNQGRRRYAKILAYEPVSKGFIITEIANDGTTIGKPKTLFARSLKQLVNRGAQLAEKINKLSSQPNKEAGFIDWGQAEKAAEMEFGREGKRARSENFLNPENAIAREYHQKVTFPRTIAEKYEGFAPIYKAARGKDEIANSATAELLDERLNAYVKLPDRKKVDATIIKMAELADAYQKQNPGAPIPNVPDQVLAEKFKLSPAEVAGFRAYRDTMERSLDIYANSEVEAGRIQPAEAEALKTAVRREQYFPHGRRGNWYVSAKDSNGNEAWFSLHENKTEMRKQLSELKKTGKFESSLVTSGKFDKAARPVLSPDLVPASASGFKQHLLEQKGIPGFERDLLRPTVDYIVKLADHSANTITAAKFRNALHPETGTISPKHEPSLYRYAQRYTDYIMKGHDAAPALRKWLTAYTLGMRVSSAATNLTQTLTTLQPHLVSEVGYGKSWKVVSRNWARAADFMTNPSGFAKQNPQDAKLLLEAVHKGILEAQISRTGREIAKGRSERSAANDLFDASMFMFKKTEEYNRIVSFLSGLDVAREKGLTSQAAAEYASNLVDATQFDMSKANAPEISRGLGAMPMMFKKFQGNYLRAFRNHVEAKRFGAAAAMLGNTLALGGLSAVPGLKLGLRIYESLADPDARSKVRKAIGDTTTSDILLYGAMAGLTGQNISSSVAVFSDPTSDLDNGLTQGLLNLALGVAADPLARIERATSQYKKGRTDKALETVAPAAVRSMMRAANAAQKGFVDDSYGNILVDKVTPGEVAGMAIGYPPTRLTRAQEQAQINYEILQDAKRSGNYNYKIALALRDGNQEKAQGLIQEAIQAGEMPNPKQIQSTLLGFSQPMWRGLQQVPRAKRAEVLNRIAIGE